ncbi:sulfatase family protein [Ilumatobacter nonamiensis]|uniref:sulfatase family protein n=1 Tax=Ilumatobacter nonamiensis TaxID=467093 RepID=UPI0003495034|nr:sulfatase-like hydrolase/transferase [Ilumatobacter nonamiensis]
MDAAPNVLFIITDQQRADHLGYAGNPIVRTPNLDALAGRSTNFTNAYVNNPICMPNRSTILTGRMPSIHGAIFNDRSLEWGANTFVRTLRSAGYRTGLIGKSHLQLGMGIENIPPVTRETAVRDGFEPGDYAHEDHRRYVAGPVDDPDDFYGFDTVAFSLDHGARVSGHHLQWALDRGGDLENLYVPYSPEAPALQRSEHWWQIYEPPYPSELHSTEFVTQRTIEFIESAHADGGPWMAYASFPDPHHPITPPGEWFGRHDPADMPEPRAFDDPLDGAPPHIRATRARLESLMWPLPFGASSPTLAQECMAGTYGMIEFIDDGIGRILDAVDRLGATGDTIVVFTTDHGDMMGEHGLMVKGNLHYQGTVRAPLLIARPGSEGATSESLAASIDISETILELCGLDQFIGMQGHSLVPILDDPAVSVRDAVLIEDDMPSPFDQVLGVPEKMRTLVTADGRYTRDSNGFEELYVFGDDPDEVENRAPHDEPRRSEMLGRLVDQMMSVGETGRGIPAPQAPG